jgi:hypothetical protein
MKLLCMAVLMFALPLPLSPQTLESPDASGNAFARVCSAMDKDNKNQVELLETMSCVFYVNGFADGVEREASFADDKTNRKVPKAFCRPDIAENGQLVRILLKYIRDNPEQAHEVTKYLIVPALTRAFPCK